MPGHMLVNSNRINFGAGFETMINAEISHNERLEVPSIRNVGRLHIEVTVDEDRLFAGVVAQRAEEHGWEGDPGAVGQGLHADVRVLDAGPQAP